MLRALISAYLSMLESEATTAVRGMWQAKGVEQGWVQVRVEAKSRPTAHKEVYRRRMLNIEEPHWQECRHLC
jgi:hypothetical protein